MIGPFTNFADLAKQFDSTPEPPGPRYSVKPSLVNLPPQEELDAHAEAVALDLGIVFQPEEARGHRLSIPLPDGGRRELERWKLYALCEPHEILDAVRAFIERLHAEFGPGMAWSLGGRVAPFRDIEDGGIACSNVDGVRHVNLRGYFCHENGPHAP